MSFTEWSNGWIWLDAGTVLPPLDEDEEDVPWPREPAGQQA